MGWAEARPSGRFAQRQPVVRGTASVRDGASPSIGSPSGVDPGRELVAGNQEGIEGEVGPPRHASRAPVGVPDWSAVALTLRGADIEVTQVTYPYALIVSQDCDLDWDYRARAFLRDPAPAAAGAARSTWNEQERTFRSKLG